MMRKKVYLSLILLLTPFISTLKAEDWQKSGFHEMRLSVGASVTDFITGYELFGNNWGNYYEGDLMGTPILNLSYSYQVKSWLSIGMIFTYCGRWQSTYSIFDDSKSSSKTAHYMTITPSIRFDWVRTPIVRMYSSIGLGLGLDYEKTIHHGAYYNYDYNNIWSSYIGSAELIPIGMSVGRKLFVFAEIGPSTLGFIKGGLGYRFK